MVLLVLINGSSLGSHADNLDSLSTAIRIIFRNMKARLASLNQNSVVVEPHCDALSNTS